MFQILGRKEETMGRSFGPDKPGKAGNRAERVAQFLERSRKQSIKGEDYREQSLRIHPWICARCGREFTNRNVHELTVHHKDHNHENNPSDGSNWENLCIYCHDNEHRRYLDHSESMNAGFGDEKEAALTHNPFSKLKGLLVKE